MAMPRSKQTLLLLLSIMLSATGCRKYLDFEGEDLQPRLVLYGLAEADSLITVYLSNSRGVIDPGPLAAITNGQVRVFDGQGNLLEELQHVGEGIYRGSQPIAVGSELVLRAEAPGLGAVRTADRVPLAVPIQQLDTVTFVTSDPGSGFEVPTLEITFTIADPGDRRNFYLLEGFVGQRYFIEQVFDPVSGTFVNDTIELAEPFWSRANFSTTDLVLTSEMDMGPDESRVFFRRVIFRDDVFNGSTRSFRVRLESIFRPGSLDFRLVSISESAFLYYRTLERYAFAQGDPFAEPVQVFTNVEGGLGIWAGTNTEQVFIDIW